MKKIVLFFAVIFAIAITAHFSSFDPVDVGAPQINVEAIYQQKLAECDFKNLTPSECNMYAIHQTDVALSSH
jgi:hypothetical protein